MLVPLNMKDAGSRPALVPAGPLSPQYLVYPPPWLASEPGAPIHVPTTIVPTAQNPMLQSEPSADGLSQNAPVLRPTFPNGTTVLVNARASSPVPATITSAVVSEARIGLLFNWDVPDGAVGIVSLQATTIATAR